MCGLVHHVGEWLTTEENSIHLNAVVKFEFFEAYCKFEAL